jgi:hypothetical protein
MCGKENVSTAAQRMYRMFRCGADNVLNYSGAAQTMYLTIQVRRRECAEMFRCGVENVLNSLGVAYGMY